MTYKNKKIFLLSLIIVLALIYTGSFVFDQESNSARQSYYSWLDPKQVNKITKIDIITGWENVELIKDNNQWFAKQTYAIPDQLVEFLGENNYLPDGDLYPARKVRIEDFIDIFTARKIWPVRSTSAASHDRFGVGDEITSRVTIYGGNTVLLDVLLGNNGNSGDIFIRKNDQNEVRSGNDVISVYTAGDVTGWYNLRFFPESEDGKLDIDSVQRLTISNEGETYTLSRQNRKWVITGVDIAEPDSNNIENYIRILLNSEGDSFIEGNPDDPVLDYSRIVVEFGNGSVKTIRISRPDEDSRRAVHVSGSDYIYTMPLWVSMRILRKASSFEAQ